MDFHASITVASLSEKPIVDRLMQLYLHDFSEMLESDDPFALVNHRGEFHYEHFDSFWQDPEREPLLFRIDGSLAGFALINNWSTSGLPTEKAMAEFFILRRYRRSGLGKRAALEIIG